jgi:hypothetical protein
MGQPAVSDTLIVSGGLVVSDSPKGEVHLGSGGRRGEPLEDKRVGGGGWRACGGGGGGGG